MLVLSNHQTLWQQPFDLKSPEKVFQWSVFLFIPELIKVSNDQHTLRYELEWGIGPFFALNIGNTVTINKKNIFIIFFLQKCTFSNFKIFTILAVESKVIEIQKCAITKNNH